MGVKSLLWGLGIGAAVMYLYDPERGNARRSMIRDRVNSNINDSKEFMNDAIEDLRNRTQGMTTEARTMLQSHSGAEAMQMDQTLSPGIRLVFDVAGGSLALYGLLRKGIVGTALGTMGLGLLARGVSNVDLRTFLGMGERTDAVRIQKSMHFDAPVDQLYSFWSNYTNFPKFMKHVKEVRDLGNGRSHWVVKGPAGKDVEWDAITTEQVPDQVIAWESVEGSPIKTNGRVTFRPGRDGGTQLNIHLNYTPPAGVVGHTVATLLGSNPKQEMDDDLARLKTLVDKGKTTVKGNKVTKQDFSEAAGD